MGVYIPNMKMPHNCIECPRLKWYVDEDGFNRGCCQEKVLYPSTIDRPNNCPLIEIVQCKDCKYGHKHILKDTYDCDKSDITVFHEADFFCKASERRE